MTTRGPRDRRGPRRLGVALGLLMGAAACSSGDEAVAPGAWASTVCGAVASWQGDLAAEAADLQQRSAHAADPAALREALLGFLTRAVERTGRLAGEVEAAGTPTGEGGEAVTGEVRTRVEDSARLLERARADAEGLPQDDGAALARGAEEVGRTLQEGSEAVAAPLGGPADTPARDALRAEPACARLAG